MGNPLGVVQRRGGENVLRGGEKFCVLRECQTPHQYRAGVDFFMSGFSGEFGKEIHCAVLIIGQKRIKGERIRQPIRPVTANARSPSDLQLPQRISKRSPDAAIVLSRH
jgi:hypothetical protein